MALACKACIASNGLRGEQVDELAVTEEELFQHLEAVHHLIVTREHETDDQARTRFLRTHPEAASCQDCMAVGAEWAGVI